MDITTTDSVTIYRKTAKGHAEIETRAHGLSLRLRSVLIMVDGRLQDRDLRRVVGEHFDVLLQELLAGGFVEVVPGALNPRPVPPRTAPVAPAGLAPLTPAAPIPPVPAPAAPVPVQAATPVKDVAIIRREAVRSLTDQIGPMAEALAIKMEKARTWAELRPLLVIGQQMLANTRGSDAAQLWQQRFIGS